VFEIRIPEIGRGRTDAGYFRHRSKVAAAVAKYDGQFNIYVTLNEPKLEVFARSADRIQQYAKQTTSDREIAKRRGILIDLDPDRVAGISSTAAQHDASLDRAWAMRDWLLELGFPPESIIIADSGNGGHLIIVIDLPNDQASTDLVKACLTAVDTAFTDDEIHVDLTTFNASRVTKLYGTIACKGDDIPDHPHRRSRILQAPEYPLPAPRDCLERLAALAPEQPLTTSSKRSHRAANGTIDVDEFIDKHGLDLAFTASWQAGGADARKWVLGTCPFNSDHRNRSALIGQFQTGAVFFRCLHNGCSGRSWRDLRQLYDEDFADKRAEGSTGTGGYFGTGSFQPSPGWPEPPGDAAFAGLAGRVVEVIDPHTEADRIALLVQSLLAVGNLVGTAPYGQVGATRHAACENAVLVGATSKARKGESWSPVKHLLAGCDAHWAAECVKSGLSTGEGLIWAVRDPITKVEPVRQNKQIVGYQEVVADPGVSDKRLLVMEPEFGRVLQVMMRQTNTLSAVIRQAWDTGELRIMTKTSPAQSTDAHISIVGHITAEELRRELTDTEAVNGFANRILWVAVRRSKYLPNPDPFTDEDLAPLTDALLHVVYQAREAGRLERDPEADELWTEVYRELSEERPGLSGAILARAEAHVLRLTMLYALLDCSPTIGASHLISALELWGYVERSVLYIFGDATGNPTADTILHALRNNGEMTRTQIMDLFGRHESSGRITQALQLLLTNGKARSWQRSTNGRPVEVWAAV
jgi:hypothetical protein